jgi:hypothetical protein
MIMYEVTVMSVWCPEKETAEALAAAIKKGTGLTALAVEEKSRIGWGIVVEHEAGGTCHDAELFIKGWMAHENWRLKL